MNIKTFPVLLFSLIVSACSSISSVEEPAQKSKDGLTYYMPKKDIEITVTVDEKGNISKVDIDTSPAYPDTTKRYVLNHGSNVFGKNILNVGVTPNGLLTATKSTTISSVNDTFKNLANALGTVNNFKILPEKARDRSECKTPGKYTFLFPTDSVGELACGLPVDIKNLGESGANTAHSRSQGEQASGIFYRQDEPFKVTVNSSDIVASSIVFSPSDSDTFFLPVSKTFFADNEADFALVDGTPTKFKQQTDSELLSLFKLPADVLAAYFAAVGNVLDVFKTTDTKEAAALTESLKLELAKKKYETCLAAIEAEETQKIKDLGCE